MTDDTTPVYSFPLPPDQSRISTFPGELRTLSRRLEALLPGALVSTARRLFPHEIARQLSPALDGMTKAADRVSALTGQWEARLEAVESRDGLDPESLSDGQAASLISQSTTRTRAAVDVAAAQVTAIASAGHAAIAEAQAATTTDLHTRIRLTPDGRTRTTLLSGQPGPVYAVPGHARSEDRIRVLEGETAQRITAAAPGTLSISTVHSPAVQFRPASIVRALVWLDDASVVSSLSVSIRQTTTPTVVQWSRPASATGTPLRTGWNLLTWGASSGVTTAWGQAVRTEVVATTTAATSITVQSVWVESPPKAQLLFIEDRGYRTFVDNGLADLRARDIPVTWALDPLLNGSAVGTKAEAITDAEVSQFYADGDDVSIHAYDGARTALMSIEQIRQDTLLSHQWIQDRGYERGRSWRAAWTQNSAPNHAAARPYYAAAASPNGAAALTAFPFPTPWNVPRVNLHGTTPAQMQAHFDTLRRTHGLMVCYTHGIHADGGPDMTPAQWSSFMQLIDQGQAQGWLEGVTFSTLMERAGGLMRS
ncbi:MAG: hypothetical protein Q4G34_00175 [Micrococcus sp.]|nr:hypothetical protein [Micrococcus sp.]